SSRTVRMAYTPQNVSSQIMGQHQSLGTRLWYRFYELCDRNDFYMCVIGTTVFTMAVFWCTNVFFMLLDVTGRPAVLQRYKVQPGKNSPLPVQQLKRVVLVGLRNQILVGVPFVTVLYYAMRWRGNTFHPAQLSSWQQGLLEMVVIVAFEEIGFYYLHSTTITHSGYHFPGFPSPEFHDFHHLKFNTNYGSLGIMDRLHGTDVMFRQSEARARHRVFFSLTPISQLVHEYDKGR
ncbi:hypothetical protein BaRGS_00012403, partial [Batillaria attramentaria]